MSNINHSYVTDRIFVPSRQRCFLGQCDIFFSMHNICPVERFHALSGHRTKLSGKGGVE